MNKEKIKIDNTILFKTKIIEVRGDVIVPDVKPDIVNIINTNCISYIYKKEVSDGKVRIDGNIETNIIYLSEMGETRGIKTTLNFVENIEDELIKKEMEFEYEIKTVSIETKVLNERKISVYAKLEVNANFNRIEEMEIIDNLEEISNVEKLQETIEIKNYMGSNIGKTGINENLNIPEIEEIAEILKSNIEIANIESKISYNKVLVKADAQINVIYLTEDNRVNNVKNSFPIMCFIDMENVKEENICNINYNIKNLNIEPNATSMHSILVQVDFEVKCKTFENKQISLIQDIYGINNDIKYKENNICVDVYDNQIEDELIKINEKIFVEDINRVIDIQLIPKINNKNNIGNQIRYECETNVIILYEAENKNNLCSKEVVIPFTIQKEIDEKFELEIYKKEYILSNENVILDLEIKTKSKKQNKKNLKVIDDICIEKSKEENEYSMIVYFIKPEDTLWKIGKKFKVSIENIYKYNEIENSKLVPGNKLYIVR